MKYKYFFLILVISLISCFSLFKNGLIPTHDGEYHVIRFYQFDKVIRDGDIFPRWAPDLNKGYGVPLFNYVYPLPNYVSSLFHLFGLSFIDSFKYNFILATLVGAIFIYLFVKNKFGEYHAFFSTAIYTFAPYRLLDIYIRGSVGEIWAIAILPGILLLIDKMFDLENLHKKASVLAVLIAMLIFSHNILALIFFPFILTYIFIFAPRRKLFFKHVSFAVLLGLMASSIFWIPALFEKGFVVGLDIYSPLRHFPQLYELIIPSWGSGFSGLGGSSGMSLQIGLANLFIVIISLLFLKKIKRDKNYRLYVFLISWFSFSIFLILPYSRIFWENVPYLSYAQFPWRYLSLVIIVCSILGGYISSLINKKIFFTLVIFFVVIISYSYTKPAYYHNRDDNYYINRENFIGGTNSPGDVFNTKWFNKKLERRERRIEYDSDINILSYSISSTNYDFNLDVKKKTYIIVNTAYFPGWKAKVNNIDHQIHMTDDGLMKIDLTKGNHNLKIFFAETIIRSISKYISLFSAVMIMYLLIYRKNYENRNR